MKTSWKDILGYEGVYKISNTGKVKSLDRKVYNKGNNALVSVKGRIMTPRVGRDGYEYIILSKPSEGRNPRKTWKIHRLVALHFCDGWNKGLVVNHKDGVKTNNNSYNLEWVTMKGNIGHSISVLGNKPKGESILHEDYVPIIKALYNHGVSQVIISRCFNTVQSVISNACADKTTHFKPRKIETGEAIDAKTIK